MALLPNLGVQAFISSAKNKIEHFLSGFAGYGWKIWQWTNGRYKLEIDDLTIRRTMTVYELIISKIRSITGSMAITQAHGKIKYVDATSDQKNYLITLEEETNCFMANDFVRMEEFTGAQRSYWVQISTIRENKIVIPKTEFSGKQSTPEIGDEIVQFGNKNDKTRQSAIYLHADETGQPAIDVMFGIDSKSFDGKVKLRLGAGLPGVGDECKGLYAENGMLKFTNKKGEVTSQIWPNGTAEFGAGSTKFNSDKSGYIGGENGISWRWDTAKKKFICTFGNDTVLQWKNLSEEVKENLKGEPGKDGTTLFTWIAYSDRPDGSGMYQIPNTQTKYIGIAVNKETATESDNPADYTWSLFKGEDGKDGTDGEQGIQGIQGCVLRKSEWKPSVEYRNDENETKGTRYIDIVLIRDEAMASGWQAYKCLNTHTSTEEDSPKNSNTHWEPFQINVNSIFTSLIIAKDAIIQFASSNRLVILNNNNRIIGGMQGGSNDEDIVFWMGNEKPTFAPFRVNMTGHIVAVDGTFMGKIEAYDGKIGYFNINNEGLYYGDISKWGDSEFKQNLASINPGLIRLQRQEMVFEPGDLANIKVGIGDGADPAIVGNRMHCASAGYFYRQMNDFDISPYYPAVKIVSDNVLNRDVALYTKGAIVCDGGMIESGHFNNANDVTVLDFSFGTTILISNSDYRYVYLPKLSDMKRLLSSENKFIVPVTIVAQYNNTENIILGFQANQTTLFFRDYNGRKWKEAVEMGPGDVIRILLIFDGVNYYAQLIFSFN